MGGESVKHSLNSLCPYFFSSVSWLSWLCWWPLEMHVAVHEGLAPVDSVENKLNFLILSGLCTCTYLYVWRITGYISARHGSCSAHPVTHLDSNKLEAAGAASRLSAKSRDMCRRNSGRYPLFG